MRRVSFFALWAVGTLAAMSLARLAVGVVADEVSVRSAAPLSPRAVSRALSELPPPAATTTTTTEPRTTTTASPPGSSGDRQSPGGGGTGAGGGGTPGATPPPASASPSPTGTSSTTTTITAAPSSFTRTTILEGGTVTVRFTAPSTVEFVSAVPSDGFTVEVEHSGPDQVEVRFRSENHESRYRAQWSDGEPDVDTQESGEGPSGSSGSGEG